VTYELPFLDYRLERDNQCTGTIHSKTARSYLPDMRELDKIIWLLELRICDTFISEDKILAISER